MQVIYNYIHERSIFLWYILQLCLIIIIIIIITTTIIIMSTKDVLLRENLINPQIYS